MRSAGITDDIGYFVERPMSLLQQLLDALHFLSLMILFYRPAFTLREKPANSGIAHAEPGFYAGRKLETTVGLIAHMMHHGQFGTLDYGLFVTVDPMKAQWFELGIEHSSFIGSQRRFQIDFADLDCFIRYTDTI